DFNPFIRPAICDHLITGSFSVSQLHIYGQYPGPQPVEETGINLVILPDKLRKLPAESLFEPVQTIQGIVFIQVPGNPAEIIKSTSLLFGPADHFPLDQVVGHHIAVFVAGGSIQVPSLVSQNHSQSSSDGLPLIFSQENLAVTVEHHIIPDPFKVLIAPD